MISERIRKKQPWTVHKKDIEIIYCAADLHIFGGLYICNLYFCNKGIVITILKLMQSKNNHSYCNIASDGERWKTACKTLRP